MRSYTTYEDYIQSKFINSAWNNYGLFLKLLNWNIEENVTEFIGSRLNPDTTTRYLLKIVMCATTQYFSKDCKNNYFK